MVIGYLVNNTTNTNVVSGYGLLLFLVIRIYITHNSKNAHYQSPDTNVAQK